MAHIDPVTRKAKRKGAAGKGPTAASPASTSLALALEPRFMYDAAGGATAAAVKQATDAPAIEPPAPPPDKNSADKAEGQKTPAPADVGPFGSKTEAQFAAAAHADRAAPISEIIFVDSRLPDLGALAIRPGVEVVVLDASRDGIAQVSEALAGRKGLTAIHFVSHGESGGFALGPSTMNAATLSERSADIAAWSAALSENADLMIWGCDVAGQASGQALMDSLAALTGADVAASTDATGSAALGGDWTLEAASGRIETVAPFETAGLAVWDHLLAPPVITASGDGTLKVTEPSILNAAGSDRAALSGWHFSSSGSGQFTATVTIADPSVGSLLNGSGLGTAVAGGWTFTGTLAEANAWLDSLTFVAADVERGNGSGKTSIALTINDGQGGSTSRAIAVEVTPSNDPTTVADRTINVTEGANGTVIGVSVLAALDPEVSAGTQIPSQIVYRLSDDPDFGYLTLNGQRLGVGSVFTQQDVIDGKLAYVHTAKGANQNTSDHFQVLVNDGATPQVNSDGATVTLNITPVNQAPTVSGGGAVYEGQPANATLNGVPQSAVGSFIEATAGGDPGDSSLQVRLTALPGHGTLFYTGTAIINGVVRTLNNYQVTAADIATGFIFDYAARSGLTYANDGVDGPNGRPPNDSFGVEVIDGGGGTGVALTAAGTIQLTIRPANDDPNWVEGSTRAATVPGPTGNKVTLTTAMLNATDVDSPPASITFIVGSQAGLDHGHLVYVDANGNASILPEGSTFTLADVQAGRVQYWQTANAAPGQTDSFNFQVMDNGPAPHWNPDGTQFERVGGVYTDPTSAGTLRNFDFTINLSQTPDGGTGQLPTRNTTPSHSSSGHAGTNPSGTAHGTLTEGGGVVLGNGGGGQPGFTYSAEGVSPAQVVYTVLGFDGAGESWNGALQKLVNGTWVKLSVYDSFTQADLDSGQVRFQHDGGEDFESSVRLRASAGVPVSDGQGGVKIDQWDTSFTFYIKPVNDAPVADGSSHTVIREGEIVAITTDKLKFGDPDDAQSESHVENAGTYAGNNGADLTFRVTSLPTGGKLQYRDDGGVWHDVSAATVLRADWITGEAGSTRLRYVHGGGEARSDGFTVQATDRWGATSNSASVDFTITNVNDTPQIAPKPTDPDPAGTLPGTGTPGSSANNPLTLYEGSYAQITPAMLQAVDADSSAQQVQYRITTAPSHGRIAYSVDGVNFTTIGVGSSFTQADVAAGRIYYLSNGDESSGNSEPAASDDKFTFTLADGAAEQTGREFWIYTKPTNDAPVVTAPPGPIPVTDTLTQVPGFSVADPDLVALTPAETDYLQVVVRLLKANGTAFSLADYAALGGIEIDVVANGALIDADHNGSNDYLVLRGTRDQINAALASLTIKFQSDRDEVYQVQVISDDRLRDASGALRDGDPSTAGFQPGANGGLVNQPNPVSIGAPGSILGAEFNWFTDAVPLTGALAGNIAAAAVTIRASSINDPATLTGGNNATTYEDQPTPIGGQINFGISDAESQAFGTPVTVTLSVPNGHGALNVAANAGSVIVSGRNSGTLTLTGTASEIQALLNASLTYQSPSNVNHDLNGAAAGDVTLTVSFSDTGSNIGSGQAPANPPNLSIALTIVPVNDAPTVSAGGGTVVLDGATPVPGFSVGDIDLGGDGQVGLADGETNFIQVTVRITSSSGAPLSALQHQEIIISSTTAPGEGATFEIDDSYGGNGSALVIRGTREQVNAYLAGLRVEFTGSLANSDTAHRVNVVADDRVRVVKTGALSGGADGGLNNNSAGGTVAVPTTAVNPYAAVPGGLSANVSSASRVVFPTDINDPAHIDLGGALITPEPGGAGVVQLGGIVVTDSDALSGALTTTVTLPNGFTIVSVNGSTSYPGVGGGTVTITGTLAEINAALNSIRIQLPDAPGAPTAGDWNGQFDVTITVNDGGHHGSRPGSLAGDTNNPGSNPGDFAYADPTGAALVTTRTFTFTVTPVNDAPQVVGDGTEALPNAPEDSAPTGQTIGSLFGGQFGDPVDIIPGGSGANSFAGVAVVGLTADPAQGAWQYYDGTSWVNIGQRGLSNALVLGADTLVRFLPTANFHGTPNALTVRLVETGDGGNGSGVPATGSVVNLSAAGATGGTTRYSDGPVVLSIGVSNVNDRPSIGNGTLPSVVEDTANPPGRTVGGLLGGSYNDGTDNQTLINGGGNAETPFGGIAIVGNAATAAQGTWQYSLDGGGNWSTVGLGVSDTAALLLPTSALLRFVPAADFNGTPGGLTVRGADSAVSFAASSDISGTVGQQTSTWSLTRSLTTTVTPRNDAPILGGEASNPTVVENNQTGTGESVPPTRLVNAGTVTLADIDLTTTPGLAAGTFGAGRITVSLGSTYQPGDVLFLDGALPDGVNVSTGPNGTLIITLDGNTTLGEVKQLIEQISYRSSSDNPTNFGANTTRGYTITVEDGVNTQPGGNAGGTSLAANPITGIITIQATNDPPRAVDDFNAIDEDTPSVGGNVIAGAAGGAGKDSDPDTAVLTVSGLSFAGAPRPVGTSFPAIYGALTLNADGSYAYALDNNNPAVNALKAGQTLMESFSYTITDGERTSTATLTITIRGKTDGGPAVVPVDGNGQAAGHAQVYERGLNDAANTSETTTGAIDLTAADGLSSVTVGGRIVTLAELRALSGSPIAIDTGEGILTLTGFTSTAEVGGVPTKGMLHYSYTLKAAQAHPGATESLDPVALVVNDAGGGSSSGTLTVRIIDDAPTAQNDAAEIVEDTSTVGGNVVTGTGPLDVDRLGADGGAVTDVSFGGTPKGVGTRFATTYGWLTLNADGSYSYQLDNDNPVINALKTGEGLTEVFSYSITDSDGDTANATLTVTIRGRTDGGPTIVPVDGNGQAAGEAEVHERGLNDPDPSETTAGTIKLSTPDGIASVEVGGRVITLAELRALGGSPIVIDTGEGILTLTGFQPGELVGGVPIAGELLYSYTLKTALNQPGVTASLDPIALKITDAGGGTSTGTLTVRIIDDAPAARNDAAEVTEDTTTAVGGNVVTGTGPGDVADRLGADGAADGGPVTGVSFGGASHGVGTRFATSYGWLTLNADGSYAYELNNSHAAVNALEAGARLTEAISYTITDADGESSTAILTITIRGSNDGPVVASPPPDKTNVDADRIPPVDVGAIFGDVDTGDTLSYTVVGLPPGLTFDPLTGLITGTLDRSASQGGPNGGGVYTVTVTAIDEHGVSVTQSFNWTVTNPPPVARPDVNETTPESTVGGNLIGGDGQGSGRDSDPDGDALTVINAGGQPVTPEGVTIAGSDGGIFTIRPDGSYVFDPGGDFNTIGQGQTATTTITYTIVDADGATATATLTITIRGTAAPAQVAAAKWVDQQRVSDGLYYLDGEDFFRSTRTGQPISQQLLFRSWGSSADTTLFYEASLGRGLPLPSWIFFDASTQVVTALPSDQVEPGIYVVRVVARDKALREAESSLTIQVLRDNNRGMDSLRPRVRVGPSPLEAPARPVVTPPPATVAPPAAPPTATPPSPDTTPQPLPAMPALPAPPTTPAPAPDRGPAPERGAENSNGRETGADIVMDGAPGQASRRAGDGQRVSLTTTLHGLGSAGRAIEATRFLEALTSQTPPRPDADGGPSPSDFNAT